MKALAALLCGLMFGAGLALSGMTDTAKVLGFLDIFGDWVPDLAFVMGGAVAVTAILFTRVLRRSKPVLADTFSLPQSRAIDGRLLAGTALFGVGWGLYGYCPGPGLAALSYGHSGAPVFVASMLAGMWAASRWQSR
ncbi:MAG: YeeE/YedE family protein [Chromatocurvus sp.]